MTITSTVQRLTMPAAACPVPGCDRPHPRYRVRCKPPGWRLPEVRVVCDQCWLAAGSDDRVEQLGPGPVHPAFDAPVKHDRQPKPPRRGNGSNVAMTLEYMRRMARSVTTSEVEADLNISRGWNVLRDLELKGYITKHGGGAGVPCRWKLA